MNQTNIDNDNPWAIARTVVESLGRIPPVFSLTIRALMLEHYRGNSSMSAGTAFLVSRLMLSPSMKSVIYHAVLTYHSEKISGTPHMSSTDLTKMFSTLDLAVIFSMIYYYTTIRQKLGSLGEDSPWFDLSRRITDDIDLAGFIGYCIPSISPGMSWISSIYLTLAEGILSLDPRVSASIISDYAINQHIPNFTSELNAYGVASLHIATNMVQRIGLGMPIMNAVITGFSLLSNPPTADSNNDVNVQQIHCANAWLISLKMTGKAPDFKMPAKFYPNKSELHRLLYLKGNLTSEGSRYKWLTKGKIDISPTLTPQLYQEYLTESATGEEIKSFFNTSLPSELLDGLSAQEIEQISRGKAEEIDF